MNKPVLVAGAGPVGLTMAMALKRRGVDVRIIDKSTARTDKSKALVLWPRTLELLDVQGCAHPFVDAGLKVTGARILARGEQLVHLDMTTARSVYRYALMLPQSDTERLLEAQLSSLGVQVERQTALTSFTEQADGIAAVLQHADGREETVHASWLAGCDGAHSTVRHHLGVKFEGDTLPSSYLLADVKIDGDIPRDELTICWTPDGVLVFFPMPGGRFRIVADSADMGSLATSTAPTTSASSTSSASSLQPPTLEDVQAAIDSRGPAGLKASDPVWLTHFGINERKVRDYRHGRAFLVGDAAHIHSPAGGQGMNTGMQDAFNLAWKLAMVWHGQASPALLDSYSPERSLIAEQVLRSSGNMTKVSILRNPILQELRGLAIGTLGRVPALRQRMVDQLTELDLHYRDSALTVNSHGAARHPASGDRAPDVALAGASDAPESARLHSLLAAGKFVALSVGSAPIDLPEPLRSIAVAARASDDDAEGYEAGHVYLIRPDAYVSMSTRAADTTPIVEALTRWLP